MLSTAVKSERAGFSASVEYDINAMVLIHYVEGWRRRVALFKWLGLINAGALAVHVTLVASEGDGAFSEEILAGWPETWAISLLEMSSIHPVPKINGFYLWLAQSGLRARWHLRVDDDSCTNLAGLVSFANAHFGRAPVHLMTSPLAIEPGAPLYWDYLMRKGVRGVAAHEYEASLSSRAAFERVFATEQAMTMLAESGALFGAPGDRALAVAMHLSDVPAVPCAVMTKDFRPTEMSVSGGRFSHVHYVNFDDQLFTRMLEAFVADERKPATPEMLASLAGKELPFGRCIGWQLHDLTFCEDGTITGSGHHHEARWRLNGDSLLLTDADGAATTFFHTVLSIDTSLWLIGPSLRSDHYHYLELAR